MTANTASEDVAEQEGTAEVDVILATPTDFNVAGMPVTVSRLRTRELLSLLGVITRGLGPGVADVKFTGDEDAIKSQFLALFMLAAPNALDELTTFLITTVHAKNEKDKADLYGELENPDPEVLIDLLVVVAEQEKDDLAALMGKARAAMVKMQGLYEKPKSQKPNQKK